MPQDIYIIGTSHTIQCGGPDCPQPASQALEAELRTAKEKGKIARICEEMDAEGLKRYKVQETIAQRFAKQEGLEYQMVDLSSSERLSLSLGSEMLSTIMRNFHIQDGGPVNQAFSDLVDGVRERVWLARILSGEGWPALFICGAEHSVSVRRLCRAFGVGSKVIHVDFQA